MLCCQILAGSCLVQDNCPSCIIVILSVVNSNKTVRLKICWNKNVLCLYMTLEYQHKQIFQPDTLPDSKIFIFNKYYQTLTRVLDIGPLVPTEIGPGILILTQHWRVIFENWHPSRHVHLFIYPSFNTGSGQGCVSRRGERGRSDHKKIILCSIQRMLCYEQKHFIRDFHSKRTAAERVLHCLTDS